MHIMFSVSHEIRFTNRCKLLVSMMPLFSKASAISCVFSCNLHAHVSLSDSLGAMTQKGFRLQNEL